jgi:hypothetical protein
MLHPPIQHHHPNLRGNGIEEFLELLRKEKKTKEK